MFQTELISNLKPNYQLIYWNMQVFCIWTVHAICILLAGSHKSWELIRSEEEISRSEVCSNPRGWLKGAVTEGVTRQQMEAVDVIT